METEALKLLEYVVKEELPMQRGGARERHRHKGKENIKDNDDTPGHHQEAGEGEEEVLLEGEGDPHKPPSKTRGRLAEARKQDRKVDRSINWAEFMSGISAFQAGGREVKATIQGRLQEERDERAKEGLLGVSGHNFK